MGVLAASRDAWRRLLGDRIAAFVAAEDPLVAQANLGAFLIWSHQPLYPLYAWLLVGNAAWPILVTWLSTPFFVAVAPLSRRHPLASRALFAGAGILNTLLSAKALGRSTAVGWFLVPCLIIALAYFRLREYRGALPLVALAVVAALALPHLGAPLHVYSAAQARSLSNLNVWSAAGLSAYLLYVAIHVRWRERFAVGGPAA